MTEADKIILIDADVVSHFISGEAILDLPKIFPHRISLLDKVYVELCRRPAKRRVVDDLISRRLIDTLPFPEEDAEIQREYFHIKKLLFKGDGEAACMAVARYTNNIIASSNLRDIAHYCKLHRIVYLTTMDFLCEGLRRGIFRESQCDDFLRKVKTAGSKLPVYRMRDFKCREVVLG